MLTSQQIIDMACDAPTLPYTRHNNTPEQLVQRELNLMNPVIIDGSVANPKRVRSLIWLLLQGREAKELLGTILKNPEDPLLKLMKKAGQQYVKRLVLDYMFSLTLTSPEKSLAYNFNLQCPPQTEVKLPLHYYVLTQKADRGSTVLDRLDIEACARRCSSFAKALLLEPINDEKSEMQYMIKNSSLFSWMRFLSTNNLKILSAEAIKAVEEVQNEFLEEIKSNTDFCSIYEYLNPEGIKIETYDTRNILHTSNS